MDCLDDVHVTMAECGCFTVLTITGRKIPNKNIDCIKITIETSIILRSDQPIFKTFDLQINCDPDTKNTRDRLGSVTHKSAKRLGVQMYIQRDFLLQFILSCTHRVVTSKTLSKNHTGSLRSFNTS